jgi:RNA-binding protein
LQRLGRALHISPSKNIITKVENTPKIGDTVVDENLKSVGTVFDIFGPVSSPYASIEPTLSEPNVLINKTLYVFPLKRRKEKRKRE